LIEKNSEAINESYDEEEVALSLAKVGKGAMILFVGTALGILFNFLSRILIARFYTPADYGMFNLFLTVLTIFATIGALGLRNGIQRNIAYSLGKENKEKVSSIIGGGLFFGFLGGIASGAVLYFLSPHLAPLFSENPDFVYYLRIAALSTPFFVLIYLLVSVFRGFQRTKERILFFNLGRNSLFLIFISIIGLLALSFEKIIIGAFFSLVLISTMFLIYYIRKGKRELELTKIFDFKGGVGRELIIFSLPLMLVDMMYEVMGWADTILIGFFSTEEAVGFYNAARPIGAFVSIGLTVSHFIYSPLVAELYAQEKFRENEIIFNVLTKWVCAMAFPIAMIFIIFPEAVLVTFFGGEYVVAAIPLQIIAVVYFINNLMGPNGATLTAYGKTKFLMYATSLAAVLNIILNILMIPRFGIIGAAYATGVSIIGVNLIRVFKLNSIASIHSLKSNTLKPIILGGIISILIGLILRITISIGILDLGFIFILFSSVFFLSMVLTKSISKEDINLFLLVEKKTGIKLKIIKDILRRFVD